MPAMMTFAGGLSSTKSIRGNFADHITFRIHIYLVVFCVNAANPGGRCVSILQKMPKRRNTEYTLAVIVTLDYRGTVSRGRNVGAWIVLFPLNLPMLLPPKEFTTHCEDV
jgi:hypothetical protein